MVENCFLFVIKLVFLLHILAKISAIFWLKFVFVEEQECHSKSYPNM